jgi:hypothetical protein
MVAGIYVRGRIKQVTTLVAVARLKHRSLPKRATNARPLVTSPSAYQPSVPSTFVGSSGTRVALEAARPPRLPHPFAFRSRSFHPPARYAFRRRSPFARGASPRVPSGVNTSCLNHAELDHRVR